MELSGKAVLERLIVDAVRTMRDAQMQKALRAFEERVLSRQPDELFEAAVESAEPRFKPMLELLLHELGALGVNPTLSIADRDLRALEAMHLAGF